MTLIALIITIIVLLILAGVTLSTLTGQGSIIENAENVVSKYNNSIVKEQQLLNEIEKYFQDYLEEGNIETAEPDILESSDIANNPEEHFGGYVTNYTTPSGDPNVQWRIFYADKSNVYLIADDYIHYDYCPAGAKETPVTKNSDYKLSFNNVYNDYAGGVSITDARVKKWIQKYLEVESSSTNSNIKAVAFMLDTNVWSAKYVNREYAEYAIGGPTLEMFIESYNKTHPEKILYCTANSKGYYVSWTEGEKDYAVSELDVDESLYVIKDDTNTLGMWISSPSADENSDGYVVRVGYNGRLGRNNYYYSSQGIRPIVCLKPETQLEKISDTEYKIVI